MDADIPAPIARRRPVNVCALIATALVAIAAFSQRDACCLETPLDVPPCEHMEADTALPPGPRSAGTSLLVKHVARVGAQRLVNLGQLGLLLPPATRKSNLARPKWYQSSLNLIITRWPDVDFKRIMHMSQPAFKHIVDTFKEANCLRDNTCQNPASR
jgi:hypothetical protein